MTEVVCLQLLVVEIIAKPRMLNHQTMDGTRWVEKQPHRCQGLVKAPVESPEGLGIKYTTNVLIKNSYRQDDGWYQLCVVQIWLRTQKG